MKRSWFEASSGKNPQTSSHVVMDRVMLIYNPSYAGDISKRIMF
jgi:hypothetical protein